jgi:metal-sulfur cluster biosynthetic enzyme
MTPDTDMTTRLLEALRDVEDPEMPVNIVDLGLVVSLQEANGVVDVALTFTAMGCPAMEMIIDDSRARLLAEPGVRAVNIDVVWDPIWTKNRVSEDGKMQLRAFGISI